MKKADGICIPQPVNVVFPAGLIGFEEQKEFTLAELPGYPHFCRLSSTHGSLSLLLVNPFAAFPNYQLELDEASAAEISLTSPMDALVLTTVTIPAEDPGEITTNLAAPLVINIKNRLGCQVVLAGSDYGIKEPLFARQKRACCG